MQCRLALAILPLLLAACRDVIDPVNGARLASAPVSALSAASSQSFTFFSPLSVAFPSAAAIVDSSRLSTLTVTVCPARASQCDAAPVVTFTSTPATSGAPAVRIVERGKAFGVWWKVSESSGVSGGRFLVQVHDGSTLLGSTPIEIRKAGARASESAGTYRSFALTESIPIIFFVGRSSSQVAIGPAGGVVRSSDGVLTVRIPPGALARSTVISVTVDPATSPPALVRGLPVSQSYHLLPSGLVFQLPAILTWDYSGIPAALAAGPRLGVAHWSPTGRTAETLTALPDSSAPHALIAPIDGFSFVALIQAPAPSPGWQLTPRTWAADVITWAFLPQAGDQFLNRQEVQTAFDDWQRGVAQHRFVESPNPGTANILVRESSGAVPCLPISVRGATCYPASANVPPFVLQSSDQVTIDVVRGPSANPTLDVARRNLRHEVGHALGIDHPFALPPGCSVLPSLPPNVILVEDNCSVMLSGLFYRQSGGLHPWDIEAANYRHSVPLQLVGSAHPLGSFLAGIHSPLRLTGAALFEAGAAWTVKPRYLRGGFTATFEFTIGAIGGVTDAVNPTGGADGFTFAIQNDRPSALGAAGQYLGYDQLRSSLVVEFDTWNNPTQRDPSDGHVSIQTRGSGRNSTQAYASIGSVNVAGLESGRHSVAVSYVVSSGTSGNMLHVTLDGALILSVPVDLAGGPLGAVLDGNGYAWLGFTSATGSAFADHDVSKLRVRLP